MIRKIALLIVIFILFTGCSNILNNTTEDVIYENEDDFGQAVDQKDEKGNKKQDSEQDEEENKDSENSKNDEEGEDPIQSIDLKFKPNEAGEIMVLMYHNIGEKEDTWVRTPENFKKDLQVLYEKGYRPISLEDFVTNNIDVEAGYTPVVITFDDGNLNNFKLIEENGDLKIDVNCAVGILEEFGKENPDFPVTATFFVFGRNPFRQEEYVEYKLNYLIEKGYDIGNHTIDHSNFTSLQPEDIQRVIGQNVSFLEGIVDDYKVNTLALPYGSRPKNKEYEKFLHKGEYNGVTYENIAVLNVGWKPSVSPIDKNFNPYSIQRVRASETNVDNVGMYDWLEYFDKHPEKRYVSDGNPDVMTIPKEMEGKVDKEKIKDKILYVYDKE